MLTTTRPPGRRYGKRALSVDQGSGRCSSTSASINASKLPVLRPNAARFSAVPTWVASKNSAPCFRRSSSGSTPTTRHPRGLSHFATCPQPQPTSNTREPSGTSAAAIWRAFHQSTSGGPDASGARLIALLMIPQRGAELFGQRRNGFGAAVEGGGRVLEVLDTPAVPVLRSDQELDSVVVGPDVDLPVWNQPGVGMQQRDLL